MHIEENILELDFEGADPLGIECRLIREQNAELIMKFMEYLMGLEMDSEEYKKHKMHWNRGRDMKAGYFKALSDMREFWQENKVAIRAFKLSAYDGVDFVLEKIEKNRHALFYHGRNLDIGITKEEMQEFRDRKDRKNKKNGVPLYVPKEKTE
jgi:hypothetical protein